MKQTIRTAFFSAGAAVLVGLLPPSRAQAQTVDPLNVQALVSERSSSPFVNSVIPLPDGKILAGGRTVRFGSSGSQWHTNLVRLNADGLVDDTFVKARFYLGLSTSASVNCLAVQTDGRILVGGSFESINGQYHAGIGRLYPDGTLETNFNANVMGYQAQGCCILPQPDEKILLGGSFVSANGQPRVGMCRLNNDGSLDTNFNALAVGFAPTAAFPTISSMSLQPDGKIVVLGSFTNIAGISRTNVARLNADGSAEPSFQPVAFAGDNFNGALYPGPLLLQPDGMVVIGSLFKTVNGLAHTNLVRLNADGTLDRDFKAQADWYNSHGVQSLTLQTDGKIIVGDDAKTLNGRSCPYLGRLNGDGSLDASFRTNIVSGSIVFSSALQSDGKILLGVGGSLSSPGVTGQTNLGRLINTALATQSLNYDAPTLYGCAAERVRRFGAVRSRLLPTA